MICALAALLVALGSTPSPPAPSVDPLVTALAERIFAESQTGKLDFSLFAPRVRTYLTGSMTRAVAKDLGRLGKPTSVTFEASRSLMTTAGTGYVFRFSFAKEPPRNMYLALDPSGKVLGLFFFDYTPEAHLNESRLIAALRARMAHASKAGSFSGAVLLAKNGSPVFQQAYGRADRARHVANTLETRFRIGSMNKMFTAVAILQLVQRGKIALNAPLGTYVTDYPNRDIATKVTIEELLTHTGGTGDFFGPEFDKQRLELKTLDDYVKLYGSRGPAFKPGSKFDYSNYGFLLLGVVIERATGESYYDYVQKNVYDLAGMTSTGSEPENVAVPSRSIGYTTEHGKIVPNTDTLPYRGTSAGGGYTTVGDLLKFANALQSHRLLDAKHTEMLTTGRVRMPSFPTIDRRYAFGFGDQVQNGIRCFGHNGGAPGMSGSMLICPVPGYTIVALANLDPPAADDIVDFVVDNMPEH